VPNDDDDDPKKEIQYIIVTFSPVLPGADFEFRKTGDNKGSYATEDIVVKENLIVKMDGVPKYLEPALHSLHLYGRHTEVSQPPALSIRTHRITALDIPPHIPNNFNSLSI
jgi:hypothetical protein